MRRRRTVVALAVTAAALAGCGRETAAAPPEPSSSPRAAAPSEPSATAELSATVLQYRSDEARGVVQVKVSNDGEVPVRIASVTLDAPGFATVERAEPDAELAPGRRVDLPVAYGDVRCDAGGVGAGTGMTVDLGVAVDSGPVEGRRLDVPPVEQVELTATAECGRLALAEVAAVEFGSGWTLDESGEAPVLRGALALRRTGGSDPLALDQVGASTLFVVRPTAVTTPLLTLDPATAAGEVPIEVTAPRCEAHAVGASQRAYTIPAWAHAGDGEPVPTSIVVDDGSRARLEELLAVSCGLAP